MTANHVMEVEAEQIATKAIYEFRQYIQGLTPQAKLLASKALLKRVRELVENLEHY